MGDIGHRQMTKGRELATCGEQNDAPPHPKMSLSQLPEPANTVPYMAKGTLLMLRILSWEIIVDYLGGSNVIIRVLIKRGRRVPVTETNVSWKPKSE